MLLFITFLTVEGWASTGTGVQSRDERRPRGTGEDRGAADGPGKFLASARAGPPATHQDTFEEVALLGRQLHFR